MSNCSAFAACAVAYAFVGASAAFAQDVVVRIANVGALGGQAGSISLENERGAQLAIEELNTKGLNIGGKNIKFELVATVEHANAQQNISAAKRLVDAKVNGAFGNWNSASVDATSKILSDAGIPQIFSGTAQESFNKQRYKTAFNVAPAQGYVSGVLGKYAVDQLKGKSIAVIDDRTEFGSAQAEAFERAVRAAGGTIASRNSTDAKATEFNSILNSLKEQKPDVIYFGGVDSTAAHLLRQMKRRDISAKFVGAGRVCTEALPRLTGDTFDGSQVVCADPNGLDAYGRDLHRFTDAYKQKFAANPKVHAAYGYDAVNVLAAAMVKANSVDPKQYLPSLAETTAFTGLSGEVKFDKSGVRDAANIAVYSYSAGRKLQVNLTGVNMPAFAWPPPAVSSMQVLQRELLTTPEGAQGGGPATRGRTATLGDLNLTLTKALDKAGYATRSYYRVPGGYAVATQLERFGDDGKPAADSSRWAIVNRLPRFDLGTIIQALFATEPGRFRVIVFTVTKEPLAAIGQAPSTQQAMEWLSGGFNVLPEELAGVAYEAGIVCTALIYEFTKSPGGAPTTIRPGSLNGDQHIRGSGLFLALRDQR